MVWIIIEIHDMPIPIDMFLTSVVELADPDSRLQSSNDII